MRSATSAKALALILALAGAACSTAAPPLPTDTTGVNRTTTLSLKDFAAEDAALPCETIARERADLRQRVAEANGTIEENRRLNQTALFLGGALALPVVSMNGAEKDFMVRAQNRLDVLSKLSAVKGCRVG
ncbi:MAG TPA: hypothetical protein VK196_20615 [Magnetospirillum sp.]|nr:hypothetical protein [Magnetospirillum sp.]